MNRLFSFATKQLSYLLLLMHTYTQADFDPTLIGEKMADLNVGIS